MGSCGHRGFDGLSLAAGFYLLPGMCSAMVRAEGGIALCRVTTLWCAIPVCMVGYMGVGSAASCMGDCMVVVAGPARAIALMSDAVWLA